jgi:ABC-type glutathione transport system ATPase component
VTLDTSEAKPSTLDSPFITALISSSPTKPTDQPTDLTTQTDKRDKMQNTITDLISDLSLKLQHLPPGKRLLIGLTGGPGSGKSKLAEALVRGVNDRSGAGNGKGEEQGEVAVTISMDGWHYTRAEVSRPWSRFFFLIREEKVLITSPNF